MRLTTARHSGRRWDRVAVRGSISLLVAVLILAGSVWTPSVPASAQQDARYFSDTGFRIDDDKVWDYFNKRGGLKTFGMPTSRLFTFMGSPSQFFQRQVVQITKDGPRTLNLLDEGLLPYTSINGSTFPAVDPAVVGAAPKAGSGDYGTQVGAYLKQYAPDTFESQPVGFYEIFSETVTLADAFPEGNGNPDLLPLLNLEIWGLPTSKPTRDPKNNNFVYLRFQRGIAQFNADCSCTQWLLLGDALKSLITGENLSDDLAQQAADNPLLRQYDVNAHTGPLHAGLPRDTELGNAFRPSLDTTAAVPPPIAQSSSPTGPAEASKPEPAPRPAASPVPTGPPDGDPAVFMLKINDAGKGAKEAETKKGSDNRMSWAYARYERERTYANFRSGPVTVYSRSIITRNNETARQIFEEETKLTPKFPEAKDKVGGAFPFNTEGDEDVGDQASGLSACAESNCNDKDNELHRRIVFRVGPFVGVVYTYGLDDPEGSPQAYTRRLAQLMVKRMRDSVPD
jgi:hypothetical protein